MAAKKPTGWKAFDKLARIVAPVDAREVEKKLAADKAKRIKQRKKK